MNYPLIFRLSTILLLAVLLFTAPMIGEGRIVPFIIIGGIIIGGVFLIRWHARISIYKCSACRRTFTISAWTDFMSPHRGGEKLLRCEHCGQSGWFEETDRAETIGPEAAAGTVDIVPAWPPISLYIQIAIVLALYAALWIFSLSRTPRVPHFHGNAFLIPLLMTILPVLHLVFCLFAAHHGYRSRIYPAMTTMVGIFIIAVIGMIYF